jgi:type II secretory pathway pseudopilin PulG
LLSPGENRRAGGGSAGASPGEAAARSGEAGYSLIELMAVVSLLVIVLGAVLALGETTQRIAPREQERAHAIREAQVGLHSMTRQLRQAYLPHTLTDSTMDVTLRNGSRYSFECDQPHPTETGYNRCWRYPVVGGVKGAGTLLIDRVMNGPAGGGSPNPNPVFAYETNPAGTVTYAHVSVDVPARGERADGHPHKIGLYDGVYMRNLDNG